MPGLASMMAAPVRLTARDGAGAARLAAGADPEQVLARLATFEDLADGLRASLAQTCAQLEDLRVQGKVKTVTYRQLSANRATLKETVALFEEQGL